MRPKNLGTLLISSAFLFGSTLSSAYGEDQISEVSEEPQRLQIHVLPGYGSMSASGRTLSTLNVGAGLSYGLSDRFATRLHFSQGFLTSGITAAFSHIQIGVNYSLFSSLIRKKSRVDLDGQSTVTVSHSSEATFQLGLTMNQYFFNGSLSAIPYSGPGISALYTFPYGARSDLSLSIQTEFLANGTKTIRPVHFIAGFSYWLF